jgi:hypothetical protein
MIPFDRIASRPDRMATSPLVIRIRIEGLRGAEVAAIVSARALP